MVHTARGEFKKAATKHKEALKYDPDNLKALTFLSDFFIAQRKLDKAAEIYEKILRIRDNDAYLYFNLGVIYSKLDFLDKAEEKLKKAIEVDAEYWEAQLVLGFIYEIDKTNNFKDNYTIYKCPECWNGNNSIGVISTKKGFCLKCKSKLEPHEVVFSKNEV